MLRVAAEGRSAKHRSLVEEVLVNRRLLLSTAGDADVPEYGQCSCGLIKFRVIPIPLTRSINVPRKRLHRRNLHCYTRGMIIGEMPEAITARDRKRLKSGDMETERCFFALTENVLPQSSLVLAVSLLRSLDKDVGLQTALTRRVFRILVSAGLSELKSTPSKKTVLRLRLRPNS